ncbi:MAG: hypothetical protein R3F65_27805 [bacterium]
MSAAEKVTLTEAEYLAREAVAEGAARVHRGRGGGDGRGVRSGTR